MTIGIDGEIKTAGREREEEGEKERKNWRAEESQLEGDIGGLTIPSGIFSVVVHSSSETHQLITFFWGNISSHAQEIIYCHKKCLNSLSTKLCTMTGRDHQKIIV